MRIAPLFRVAAPALCLLLFAACGGGGGRGGGSGPGDIPDTDPPFVTSTAPASGETDVALNRVLVSTFNEPMDSASISTGTILVADGIGAVAGTVAYDPGSRSASFDPSPDLAASTTYTVTVTTGVQDVAGNALAAPYTWSFTTGATSDSGPPTVISTTPADLATGVMLDALVTAVFSEAMDPASIDETSFTLSRDGIPVSASVTFDPATRTAMLDPLIYFSTSTTYEAMLSTAVRDSAGNPMASMVPWSFTTTPQERDGLGTAVGPAGPFNPDQVLDYYLTLPSGDWQSLVADATNSRFFQAGFHADGEAPITVGVRRKRSGTGSGGKVGLKIDINYYVPGQTYHDLRKLSLENGISEGSTVVEVKDLLAEYLAWRWMNLGGVISGRASIVRVHVNGASLGAYVNVEVVDKRFLKAHLGHNDGWLFKKSGGPRDGYKTNEALPNPYEDYFCFWSTKPCPVPPDVETSLPGKLVIVQMLKFGGVSAIIGNADSPFRKDNNYYFYDWPGRRVYLPWDLDTTMKGADVFTPPPPSETMYRDVLFTHWEDDYDRILTALLAGPLTVTNIDSEIDRIAASAGPTLDSDPNVVGDTASTVTDIKGWWAARHAEVQAQVDAHPP